MSSTRLYGAVWRWHFIAGLMACPIVFVIAVTGALWSFQPELDRATSAELLTVEPAPTRVPVDALIAAARTRCTPLGATLPGEPDRAAIVYCAEGTRHEVYVDPYRGTVLGERHATSSFFGVVFSLHFELLLGTPGRYVIEWASALVMMLLISGLVLWWPRGKRRGAGVWWPRRVRAGNRRLWLRDLHAVLGAYALPALIAMTATGLMWTLWAGQSRWHPLTEDVVHETWDHPPLSTVIAGAPRIGTDAALAAARLDPATDGRAIYFVPPVKPEASYAFYLFDPQYADGTLTELVWIDAYAGRELGRMGWDERTAMGKLDSIAYGIHIGTILGLPGRILACLAALILAALCVTGPWMWWKRRPRGELGVPPPSRRRPWVLFGLVVALGWLLPTVGVTVLAVLALEGSLWLWRLRGSASSPINPG